MTNNYKFNNVHPLIEIWRMSIMQKFFDRFYEKCKNQNNNFNRLKSDDFITRFCWRNTKNVDPVIPHGPFDFKQLKVDLDNYNLDSNIVIEQLRTEEYFSIKMKKFELLYNNLNLSEPINIEYINNELIYVNNEQKYKVTCDSHIYSKFEKFYNNQYKNNKLALYFCVLYRYSIMDAKNQQLTANINFKQDMKLQFNINCELFGSAINRTYDKYCSLYYDIEQYFGSLGNFFNIVPTEGLYFANPPFDEELMAKTASHFINTLDTNNNSKPLGFIITIPIWNKETQIKISKICQTKVFDMGPYQCYNTLKQSKYFYHEFIFCKNKFPYYNFLTNNVINATNTYIIIIKNNALYFDIELFKKILDTNKLYTIDK